MTSQGPGRISLNWTLAAGSPPVSLFKIFRNGVEYATTGATHFTDTNAVDATVPTFDKPAKIYSYSVSAMDATCRESAQTSQLIYWVYHAGKFLWAGDYSAVRLNYSDSAGAPEDGRYDVSVTASAAVTNGYAQPYSGPPESPEYAAEIGAFKFMVLDLKPTVPNQIWVLNLISRLPQGDVYNKASVTLPGRYGPEPVVGQWAHYRVPLTDLAIGTGSLIGAISGTTLTVSGVNPGISVQPTVWLAGAGVPAATSITAFGTGTGGAGTYTLNHPGNVPPGTVIALQRTNLYKFALIDQTNRPANIYYMNNLGFTSQ